MSADEECGPAFVVLFNFCNLAVGKLKLRPSRLQFSKFRHNANAEALPAMLKTISPTIKSLYLIANLNMTRQALIERTIKAINQLPDDKASEISDFIEFIIKRYEEDKLSEAIQHIAANGKTFDFLNDEEELYSEADLKEKYNG